MKAASFLSQQEKYLKSGSNYATDYATSVLIGANAYGAKQDILTSRQYDLLSLTQSKKEEALLKAQQETRKFLIILAGATISIAVVLLILFKK